MTKKSGHSVVPGLILIALGIIFLLGNLEVFHFDWDVIWTYFIIILGIIFWIGYFTDRSKIGLLMPGTVLLTVGLVFHYAATRDWDAMNHLWPFFILAPAFGFYAMFLFGTHERGLLVPAGILTILGLVFLLQSYDYSLRFIWPLALIVIGVILLFKGPRKSSSDQENISKRGGDQ